MLIAPSILSANMANLRREVDMLNASAAKWIHFDIMDGVFVPNLSFGFPVLEAVRRSTTKTLDVHLMIVEPERYIERFANAGANIITVHYEACRHLHRTLEQIHAAGAKAGVALNPHTPAQCIEEVAALADMVLVMSVNPGFGGQQFIDNSLSKISRLRNLLRAKRAKTLIEVDGGVTLANAHAIKEAGADVLVAGSLVFSANEPAKVIELLEQV